MTEINDEDFVEFEGEYKNGQRWNGCINEWLDNEMITKIIENGVIIDNYNINKIKNIKIN